MLLHRLRKKATTAAAAEACLEAELLDFKLDTLTLEEKVTRYFEQWRDPVNRYLVAAFGDPVEAEEITQEAFLQLYTRLHSGQSIVNVRAWVFRAAHSLAISRIRSQQQAAAGGGAHGRGQRVQLVRNIRGEFSACLLMHAKLVTEAIERSDESADLIGAAVRLG